MSSSENPAIALSRLRFAYENQREVIAIDDWTLQAGQRLFLCGPSGSGKSTLLNLLTGILTPSAGQVTLFGKDFSGLSARKKDTFRARHIGVVFQQFNLIPYLSVDDNIRLAAYFAGKASRQLASCIQALLTALQLPKTVLAQRADALSVGQQQRVAIARALINSPELLIVDEPTSALDGEARDAFMQLLLACCDQYNSTLLFVSHDNSLAQHFSVRQSLSEINQCS